MTQPSDNDLARARAWAEAWLAAEPRQFDDESIAARVLVYLLRDRQLPDESRMPARVTEADVTLLCDAVAVPEVSDRARWILLRILTERLVMKPAGEFSSYEHWVNKARSWLAGYRGTACFDKRGRLCVQGSDFMRARDEDAFPVSFYVAGPRASLESLVAERMGLKPCRRCSECEGMSHHWMEGGGLPDECPHGEEGLKSQEENNGVCALCVGESPSYVCKHCEVAGEPCPDCEMDEERAATCERCGGEGIVDRETI